MMRMIGVDLLEVGSRDTMVFVFKLDENKEYDVYVCQNYYETFVPFNENDS